MHRVNETMGLSSHVFSFCQGPKQQSVDDSYEGNLSRTRVIRIPVSTNYSVKNGALKRFDTAEME